MANKDPAFLFYPADFIVGCADLTMEERGQYITLLCLQHQKGRLNDRAIRLSIQNVSEYVLSKFDKDEQGNYYNKRLEAEIIKRENYAKSRYENGCKGGRPKKTIEKPYGFENETICQTIEKPTQNHSENEIINKDIIKDIIKISNDKVIDLFNILWDVYPRKENKQYSLECFAKIEPDADMTEQIKKAILKARRWRRWSNPTFIPYLSTYIEQKRWEDEIPNSELSSFDIYESDGMDW